MYCIINAALLMNDRVAMQLYSKPKDVESGPQGALQNTIYTKHIQLRTLILKLKTEDTLFLY